MHDNAHSHSTKKTNEYLNKIGFKDTNLIKQPACLMEQLAKPFEEDGLYWKQFMSKDKFCNAILDDMQSVSDDEIKPFTKINEWFLKFVSENEEYISIVFITLSSLTITVLKFLKIFSFVNTVV